MISETSTLISTLSDIFNINMSIAMLLRELRKWQVKDKMKTDVLNKDQLQN